MPADRDASHTVWVLTRATEREDFIIGVFGTPNDAWSYLRDAQHLGWDAPRGGRQCWRYVDGPLVYRLEPCTFRGQAPSASVPSAQWTPQASMWDTLEMR